MVFPSISHMRLTRLRTLSRARQFALPFADKGCFKSENQDEDDKMQKIILPLLAVLALTATSVSAAPVRVAGGLISGAEAGGVRTWFGVPYAAPPVGQNRWRAPQPVVAWKGVKDTTAFSPACRQTATW